MDTTDIVFELAERRDRARIKTDDSVLMNRVRDYFSVKNKGRLFCKDASERIYLISPLFTCLTGLVPTVLAEMRNICPGVKVSLTPELEDAINPLAPYKDELLGDIYQPTNTKFQYRDYQLNAARAALSCGRGVLVLPTSSGKSICFFAILMTLLKRLGPASKALVVVPGTQLVEQFHSDFMEYGFDGIKMQKFSGSNKEPLAPDTQLVVANRQYIERRRDELPEFDVVMVDETHMLTRDSKVSRYVQNMKAPVKLGMTGTLPDDQEDVWNIMGVLGPVLYEEKIYDLQEQGFISKLKIRVVRFLHRRSGLPEKVHMAGAKVEFQDMKDARASYDAEVAYLEEEPKVNQVILAMAKRLKGNTLVLFDHIEHGRRLFDMLDHGNKHFIDGSVVVEDRELVRATVEEEGGVVVVANTRCFSVGINIKRINNIIFAMGCKGTVKVIQSIGRALRLHQLKSHAVLVDVCHNLRYSNKHYLERKRKYLENYKIEIQDEDVKVLELE